MNTEFVCEKLRQYLKNGTVQNICRICFTDLENSPISCEQKYTSICFYEELTSITINPNDNQTMNFCTECVSEIENCYKFRKKCIEANMMMEDISNEIGLLKFEDTENDFDRPLNNNLEIISNSDLNVKQEDMKDECQVYEVEFLEESILESENSSKKYREETTNLKLKKKTKTGSKVLKRGRRKREKNVGVLDMATTIQETESNEEQKLNICLVCKKPFLNENDLMIHMSLHMQKKGWECNVCNKECKDRTTLRRHILRHMTVKPYKCDNCGKTFCELCDLKKHMRVHTGEIVVKNKCSTCKTTFGSRAALSEHRPCAAAPRWACWCGRALGSRRLLASHQRVHDARKPHACPHCHKRFRHDSTLITHLRTHTGEKPYMCSVCGRTFIQGSNLSLHMRTHTGEKPYSCKTCPMKFSSGSSLKAHTLSHAEAKYKCEVCGKQLSPASIVGHRRLHAAGAGAGPRGGGGAARGRHACSLCGKSFSTPAVLREHTHLHTGERPFECKRCPKKFPTKTRLNKHEKNKHEIKVQKVKPKNQKRTKNKTKGQVITGTNYKFVNEIQLQDVTDSEDRLVIAVESEELHLQASGKTKADLENSNDNATCSPITDELNNENVMVVKEDIEVSETFIGSGHNEVSTSK